MFLNKCNRPCEHFSLNITYWILWDNILSFCFQGLTKIDWGRVWFIKNRSSRVLMRAADSSVAETGSWIWGGKHMAGVQRGEGPWSGERGVQYKHHSDNKESWVINDPWGESLQAGTMHTPVTNISHMYWISDTCFHSSRSMSASTVTNCLITSFTWISCVLFSLIFPAWCTAHSKVFPSS